MVDAADEPQLVFGGVGVPTSNAATPWGPGM